MIETKLAYTIPEACNLIGVGVTRFYQEINSGRIKAKKYGRKTLIPANSLKEWFGELPEYPNQ